MKKAIFGIGIFIILILICNISNATTITVTPEEPIVGDEITVTVTVPNVHTTSVTANVSGAVSGTIKVVGGDLSGEANDYSKSAKFTCSQEGNINIEITSDSTAVLNGQYVDVSASKTVTVKAKVQQEPTTPPATDNNQTQTPTETQKSSEARLSNFGIKPNDFSGFKRDKTEYSVEVPNNVSEVEVYATKVHKNATVSGTGKVSLKEGNNTVKVTVTAEDKKTTKTYTLTIKRRTVTEEEALKESSDATLKNLGIKPEEYDFSGFKKDTTEYAVEVPNEVTEIEVYAEATDSKAQITGTGMIELKEGENPINVEVIAQDGTKKTYTIKVTRKAAETTTEETPTDTVFGLSKLSIAGLTLSPSFKVGNYEYNIDLKEDLSSLEITAKANDKDATVEIIGNENLQQGENIITILVSKEAEEEAEESQTATYQIIVNKNVVEAVEKVQTSWLKPSTWGKEEIIKIVIIVVLIILIICAIILKMNISKENKKAKKVDFPGADELDKAIAEHQELSGEEIENAENVAEEVQNNETLENDVAVDNIEAQERTKKEVQKFLQEDFMQEEVSQKDTEVKPLEDARNTEFSTNYIEDIARNRFGETGNQEEFVKKPRRRGKHF